MNENGEARSAKTGSVSQKAPRSLSRTVEWPSRKSVLSGAASRSARVSVCVGTAWAATLAGVSLALGAFLGGLVVADTEFRHQALADLTAESVSDLDKRVRTRHRRKNLEDTGELRGQAELRNQVSIFHVDPGPSTKR